MEKPEFTKNDIILIVADFARHYNTEAFINGDESLQEVIFDVSDMINFDVDSLRKEL